MPDRFTKCKACNGRGYFRCECWPGDCICGQDEETCWECAGDGVIDNFYDDYYPDEESDPAPPAKEQPEGGDA